MSDDGGAAAGMSRRDELEALLPFYLNGTLDGDDLAAVEAWLAADAAAARALAEAEAELDVTAAVNAGIRPPGDAFSRFSRALDGEPRPAAARTPSPVARLWEAFWAIPASVAWAAAAAAIALVLVQTVMQPPGRGGPIEIAGSQQAALPFVLVTFKPDARIADVAAFLGDQGAVIVSGPAPGGIFKVAVPARTANEYDRISGLIAAQPFTESVTIGRKPDDGG